MPPYLLIQNPWFQLCAVYRGLKKNWNIKEINDLQVSKCPPNEKGPYHGELQQPKCAQYLTHLPLPPYSNFPAELASILLLAFSQCLCSASPYLSIKLYLIYELYRNTVFSVIHGFM
jgi:hypothetical protein